METKRCSGYKGVWACGDNYPDHEVPVGEFGTDSYSSDGLQGKCRRCHNRSQNIRNDTLQRHPKTGQRKIHWLTARAKEYYGGMPSDPKNDARWKGCRAKATEDAETSGIKWVVPSNVVELKTPEPTFDNAVEYVETVTKGRKRDQKVVDAIRAQYDECSVIGCDYKHFDVAHIYALRHGADDLPDNCFALCPNHHRDLDRGRMFLYHYGAHNEIDFMSDDGGFGAIELKHEINSRNITKAMIELEGYRETKVG